MFTDYNDHPYSILFQDGLASDTISDIRFSPIDQSLFACSTWDGQVILYNISNSQQIIQIGCFFQYNEPVTCIAWRQDGAAIFAGCGDNTIQAINLDNKCFKEIGRHESGIRSIFFVAQLNNTLVSCSFDKTICFWQEDNIGTPIAKIQLEGKVFAADCVYPVLALGLSGELVTLINLQDSLNQIASVPVIYSESILGLSSQISSIRVSPQTYQFAIGTIDGRIGYAQLIRQEKQGQQTFLVGTVTMTCIAHKTVSQSYQKIQNLYPVNALCFNPRSEQFLASVGSDGNVFYWDMQFPTKIRGYYEGSSISACVVSPNGQFIVYAIGNDYHRGYSQNVQAFKPKIFARMIPNDFLFAQYPMNSFFS